MDDIIEQAFNEAKEAATVEEAPKQPSQEAPEEIETEQLENEPESKKEEGEDEGAEEVIFPKKAVNAIARRDKKIAKLQAEHQQVMQRLAELEQSRTKEEVKSPSADDFDTFDDYLSALVDFRLKGQAQPKQEAQPQMTEEQVREQIYYQQRAAMADTRDAELVSALPDYEQLKEANADILTSFTPDIVKAIYEMDDAPVALYALAKEGKLESLLTMSPMKAAIELAKAESRGLQYLNRRPSAAPQPIKGVSGTSHKAKTFNNMSADDVVNWLNN